MEIRLQTVNLKIFLANCTPVPQPAEQTFQLVDDCSVEAKRGTFRGPERRRIDVSDGFEGRFWPEIPPVHPESTPKLLESGRTGGTLEVTGAGNCPRRAGL